MTGTHLYHGNLMLLGQTEERLGYTHVIVEVPLGIEHIVFLREYGSHEFLCGGLAVGACDANHRDIELAPMLARQVFEGL